jgi:hypothetical protein
MTPIRKKIPSANHLALERRCNCAIEATLSGVQAKENIKTITKSANWSTRLASKTPSDSSGKNADVRNRYKPSKTTTANAGFE